MKCPFCNEGKVPCENCIKENPDCDCGMMSDCPHCQNGEITLAVEEDCPLALTAGVCPSEDFGCASCPTFEDGKITRPLTDEEAPNCKVKGVSSLVPLKEFIEYVEQGLVTYNGLPVVIKKGE